MLVIDKFEKTSRKGIAKLFKPCALGRSKWLVGQLSYSTADSNLTAPEMADQAQPVLMIDGRKEAVETLRIYQ